MPGDKKRQIYVPLKENNPNSVVLKKEGVIFRDPKVV